MPASSPSHTDTTQMRDDDFEALVNLKALLETESWTEDDHDPEDESADPIPVNCMPEMWTFFSTDGTSFRGKWVNKNGKATKPIAYQGEEDTLIVNLSPSDEKRRREFRKDRVSRSECMFDFLRQETQFALPPPHNVRGEDEVKRWREETGGWHLRISDIETHDCAEGVEFVAFTTDAHGRWVERLLITGEVNAKGIDVLLFPKKPRWVRYRENPAILKRELALLHFVTLFFGKEKWEIMGPPPPPSPVKARSGARGW